MDRPAPPSCVKNSSPGGRLPGLDLLRGIAALCVLHFHVLTVYPGRVANLGKGYLAVDFFFMLSGYVMARTYEHHLASGYGAVRFMVGRYRRLWPVMAIGTVIGAPMVVIEIRDPGVWAPIVLANLFLLPALTQFVMFPVNSAAWSILAELAVNLLHATVLWRLPSRALACLIALLFPVLAAMALDWQGLDRGAGTDQLHAAIVRATFAYAIGILLWRRWRDVPPLRIPSALAFLAMPTLLLAGQFLQVRAWYADVAFICLCPLLVAGGLAYRGDGRIAAWLGAISFPLYAVNSPLLHWTRALGIGPLTGIACALILATCIAHRMKPRTQPIASAAVA